MKLYSVNLISLVILYPPPECDVTNLKKETSPNEFWEMILKQIRNIFWEYALLNLYKVASVRNEMFDKFCRTTSIVPGI